MRLQSGKGAYLLLVLVGSQSATAEMCPDGMYPRQGQMMSINGVGGGGYSGGPSVCMPRSEYMALASTARGHGGEMSRETRIADVTALLSLKKGLRAGGRCETQIDPSAQLCFQQEALVKYAKQPDHTVSRNQNTVNLIDNGKHVAMLVVEKYEERPSKKKKRLSVDHYLSPATYKITFNSFGQELKREGKRPSPPKDTDCTKCIESLEHKLAIGQDTECGCRDDMFSFGIRKAKRGHHSHRSSGYSEKTSYPVSSS
jgi:Polar tube protein 2 from Microsporidia